MALEALILHENSVMYEVKDYNCNIIGNPKADQKLDGNGEYWDSPPASSAAQDTCSSDHGSVVGRRRKRRLKIKLKNKEEMENQRMTHIAVERNRRRQMNDYLAVLRSLMPPSYAQRGDQASIVGGAINYVKELEQLLQYLQNHKPAHQQESPNATHSNGFSNFSPFPQYSTSPTIAVEKVGERHSDVAVIKVAMMESHATIKVSSKKRPKQLLKIVDGLQSIWLTILHLNITTIGQSVLYSFSVKVEDGCHLTTVNEIATAVNEIVGMIQEESMSS